MKTLYQYHLNAITTSPHKFITSPLRKINRNEHSKL